MTVLVTGANGHVGANLVRVLLQRGDRVRAFVHRDNEALKDLPVEFVRGDVTDAASVAAAMDKVAIVFHLAALISIDGPHRGVVRHTNVDGVRTVAEAALAAGVRRLVHFSSIHAFDQAPLNEPLDEQRAKVLGRGHPAYDLSKAEGEIELREVIAKGLDAVIVNPAGIIGPHDYTPSRMGRVLLQLYNRRIPALVEGGFNWVDVRDVVAGALAAGEHGRTGENYLLSGHWLSVHNLGKAWGEVTGVAAPALAMPMWAARAAAPLALMVTRFTGGPPSLTPESMAALRANRDIRHDKATAELGYRPRPIEETLEAIYRWLSDTGRLAA